MKVGDLVIFPDNGIVLEQGEDWENGEKMWRVVFFNGIEDRGGDLLCFAGVVSSGSSIEREEPHQDSVPDAQPVLGASASGLHGLHLPGAGGSPDESGVFAGHEPSSAGDPVG